LPKTPATVATGSFPTSVAVTPDGASAYVTNQDDNTVSQYSVDPVTGALSPKTPATVAAGFLPFDLAVTADGKHVYVSDIGDSFHGVGAVSQYSVDPSTGALSLMTPATIATGGAAKGLAVGPLPAPTKDPTFASVSCSPSVFAPGDAAACKATVTDAAGSGQRTPTGTVSFTTSGAGGFFGSPCTLAGRDASASCTVFFTSFARGGGRSRPAMAATPRTA
jgi:DNA-binding beta-propeller fold protein YncE